MALGDFLKWEVIIAASPFLLVWLLFIVAKRLGFFEDVRWTHLLADAELIPWSMPMFAVAIHRVAARPQPNDDLLWIAVLFLITTTGSHVTANLARYNPDPRVAGVRRYLAGSSIVAALSAIIIGALATFI
jgi:hypothetical protein